MKPDNELEGRRLSDEIDRELKRLPLPHAPHTLLPRVLQAVERAARPWYSRAWFTWPSHWRLASVAAVALIAYGVWRLPPAPGSVVATAGTVRVLWETLIQPLLPYLLVLMVLMGVACAAFGVVLNYVLLERVEQPR